MRIAYVSHNLIKTIVHGGVGKKIRAQMQLWEKMGHETCWFVTSSAPVDLPGAVSFTFGETSAHPLRLLRKLSRELDRAAKLDAMIAAVRAYQPEMIYLRYGIYTYPLHRLFSIAPVVMELNTLDVVETRERGLFRYLLNRASRGFLFRKSAGIVAVTEEIARHPSNARHQRPVRVVPNNIDLSGFSPPPAPKNAAPRLAFIGTPGNVWNGEDKLVWLGKQYPDLQIDIIGCAAADFPGEMIPDNITLHGFLNTDEYFGVLSKADVGVGTLALHRKGMEEASPLKVREYLALGIPVLLGYRDTALHGAELEEVLEIPNCESNIVDHAEQIRAFAYRMQGKRVQRSAVAPLIDSEQAEAKKVEFFRQILGD